MACLSGRTRSTVEITATKGNTYHSVETISGGGMNALSHTLHVVIKNGHRAATRRQLDAMITEVHDALVDFYRCAGEFTRLIAADDINAALWWMRYALQAD